MTCQNREINAVDTDLSRVKHVCMLCLCLASDLACSSIVGAAIVIDSVAQVHFEFQISTGLNILLTKVGRYCMLNHCVVIWRIVLVVDYFRRQDIM